MDKGPLPPVEIDQSQREIYERAGIKYHPVPIRTELNNDERAAGMTLEEVQSGLTPKAKKHYAKCGIPTNPTHNGRGPNQGRILIGRRYPNEGYAVIRCGNTEVQIGYTAIYNIMIHVDGQSNDYKDQCDLEHALDHIRCEAMLGRTGDD